MAEYLAGFAEEVVEVVVITLGELVSGPDAVLGEFAGGVDEIPGVLPT